ncbi:GlcNAc-PI de-N-acetylase [Streptomyces spinoverrucosus]|uniref:GlcNAc-PI de-N-acetylase n=1 Tax=Streptomyces spinoverrucosus TaxID=284043 RepID=A0A4Y3VTA6_9ACTN|nr:PIG-L deacetylase family protein [Streptomyces spinoverrucosus]GEC10214.1 GlcNAc-PI de-N-acetylase [Streptomyces spinoverrucosus]GHB98220.1 GlcNAc-PI de-N-acetylase [Streptomyces spinoverrucosus]
MTIKIMTTSRMLRCQVPEDWRRGLAVVAHPDDLEFGASSAIARWTAQGKTVVDLLVTRGEAGIESMPPERTAAVRSAEQVAAAGIVGVDRVEFLAHPDGTVEYGIALRRDLARAIRHHCPDVIISLNFRECFDSGALNHADHRAVGSALIDAVRDAANRWVFPELLDEGLQPWSGVRCALFSSSPEAEHFVDVTAHLDRGVESLAAHEAYLDNLAGGFDPEQFLRRQATDAGRRAGVPLAVAFEVVPL